MKILYFSPNLKQCEALRINLAHGVTLSKTQEKTVIKITLKPHPNPSSILGHILHSRGAPSGTDPRRCRSCKAQKDALLMPHNFTDCHFRLKQLTKPQARHKILPDPCKAVPFSLCQRPRNKVFAPCQSPKRPLAKGPRCTRHGQKGAQGRNPQPAVSQLLTRAAFASR